MYLMIMEDGSVVKGEAYTEDELNSCDDGYMELIDISKPKEPKSYYRGKWISIEDV